MSIENESEENAVTQPESKAGAVSNEELLKRYDNAVADNVKYRQERAEYRKQIQALEEQARKASELEERVAKMTASHRQALAIAELKAVAVKEGIVDPIVVKTLAEGADLKFNDEGHLTNAEDLVASFKTNRPKLFAQVNHSASSVHEAPEPTKAEAQREFTKEELALPPSRLFKRS